MTSNAPDDSSWTRSAAFNTSARGSEIGNDSVDSEAFRRASSESDRQFDMLRSTASSSVSMARRTASGSGGAERS